MPGDVQCQLTLFWQQGAAQISANTQVQLVLTQQKGLCQDRTTFSNKTKAMVPQVIKTFTKTKKKHENETQTLS